MKTSQRIKDIDAELKKLARQREELTRLDSLPKRPGNKITLVLDGQPYDGKSKSFRSSTEEEVFLYELLQPLAESFLKSMRERHENLVKEAENE